MCLNLCAEIRSDTKPCTPDTGPAEEGQIMSSLKVDQNITLSFLVMMYAPVSIQDLTVSDC